MSAPQQQLNRLATEKDKLTKELERTRGIIKVSDACETLIAFIRQTQDPFSPDWKGANPWLSSPENAACKCQIA